MRVIPATKPFTAVVSAALIAASCSASPPLPAAQAAPFNVVEASIAEMQTAMHEGRTTSREIVTQYLTRIGLYEDTLNVAVSVNRTPWPKRTRSTRNAPPARCAGRCTASRWR